MMNKQKLSQVEELFRKEIEAGRLADASLLIFQNDKEEFFRTWGAAKRDTIFEIFSMTKPVTAVAVMILYERGFLDLCDPVSKYLPAFEKCKVLTQKGGLTAAKTPITIKHCMDMTSGLVYPGNENKCETLMAKSVEVLKKKYRSGKPIALSEFAECFAKAPLIAQPGEVWHYGISADVLGMIVSVISGMKLSDFMAQEIFEPLGMNDTGFSVPEEKRDRLAVMYMTDAKTGRIVPADEKKLEELVRRGVEHPIAFEAGGSGLYSTIDDYSVFARMLLNGGEWNGRRILGRKTVEFMRTNQLTKEQMKGIYFEHAFGYGYGNLMRVLADKTVTGTNGSIGEYGWDGLPGNYFFIDPEEKMILVYMQQIAEGQDASVRRKLRQIVYGSLE